MWKNWLKFKKYNLRNSGLGTESLMQSATTHSILCKILHQICKFTYTQLLQHSLWSFRPPLFSCNPEVGSEFPIRVQIGWFVWHCVNSKGSVFHIHFLPSFLPTIVVAKILSYMHFHNNRCHHTISNFIVIYSMP